MAHPLHEGDGLAKRLGNDPHGRSGPSRGLRSDADSRSDPSRGLRSDADSRRRYLGGKSMIIKGIILYL